MRTPVGLFCLASLYMAACGRLGFGDTAGNGQGAGDGGTDGAGTVDAPVMCNAALLACTDVDLGMASEVLTSGNISNASDDTTGSCGGGGDNDRAFSWTAPAAGRWLLDTQGSSFDTVLYVRSTCAGNSELACNDDDPALSALTSAITIDLVACQQLMIAVDGAFGTGGYQLAARRKCPGTNLGSAIGANVMSGSITGWGDSYTSTCGGGGEPDVALSWAAPATGTFRFTTQGSSFDTVLSLRSSCSSAPLDCNDDDPMALGTYSTVTRAVSAGETIIVVIDSVIGTGNYQLGITQL